jgi:hypothetical protein
MIIAETNLHPEVRDEEYKRLLRVPADFEFTGAIADNVSWAKQWFAEHGRPWLWARTVDTVFATETTAVVGGIAFESRELARRFRLARGAAVVAVSAGVEAEMESARRWEAGEPDRYFFLESYASAVVEALMAEARARLCAWSDAGDNVLLPHYCPGYHGWPVTDQARLVGLLTDTGIAPGPLEVMESGMLRPKKSQVGLFGVAPSGMVLDESADLVPCKYCAHVRCEFRREPFAVAS